MQVKGCCFRVEKDCLESPARAHQAIVRSKGKLRGGESVEKVIDKGKIIIGKA